MKSFSEQDLSNIATNLLGSTNPSTGYVVAERKRFDKMLDEQNIQGEQRAALTQQFNEHIRTIVVGGAKQGAEEKLTYAAFDKEIEDAENKKKTSILGLLNTGISYLGNQLSGWFSAIWNLVVSFVPGVQKTLEGTAEQIVSSTTPQDEEAKAKSQIAGVVVNSYSPIVIGNKSFTLEGQSILKQLLENADTNGLTNNPITPALAAQAANSNIPATNVEQVESAPTGSQSTPAASPQPTAKTKTPTP